MASVMHVASSPAKTTYMPSPTISCRISGAMTPKPPINNAETAGTGETAQFIAIQTIAIPTLLPTLIYLKVFFKLIDYCIHLSAHSFARYSH